MKILGLLLIACVVFSCNVGIDKDTPTCIKKEIRKFKKGTSCEDANVSEYIFQGKTVFVFEPGTCGADMSADVYDNKCNYLGYLGGIAGNTQINDEEFSSSTFVKTIWNK